MHSLVVGDSVVQATQAVVVDYVDIPPVARVIHVTRVVAVEMQSHPPPVVAVAVAVVVELHQWGMMVRMLLLHQSKLRQLLVVDQADKVQRSPLVVVIYHQSVPVVAVVDAQKERQGLVAMGIRVRLFCRGLTLQRHTSSIGFQLRQRHISIKGEE